MHLVNCETRKSVSQEWKVWKISKIANVETVDS